MSQLRRLSLLMFYPARVAVQVVERAVDVLNLGTVKYGFYDGNLALSSRGASLPEVSALDLPALSPLPFSADQGFDAWGGDYFLTLDELKFC